MDNLTREVDAIDQHDRFERDLFGRAVSVGSGALAVAVLLGMAFLHYSGLFRFSVLSALWWADR